MEQKTNALPTLGFGEAVKKNFNSLTDFKGRSRRSELWWNFLLYFGVTIILYALLAAFPMVQSVATTIAQVVILAAVTTRRLHDRGHSGLWVAAAIITGIVQMIYSSQSGMYEALLSMNANMNEIMAIATQPVSIMLSLISCIVNIVILVFCLMDGKPEDNKYGASPKYKVEEL